MASVAVDVSRVLRQCGQYVRWGNSARAFHHIDNYAHERLAILSSRNTASGPQLETPRSAVVRASRALPPHRNGAVRDTCACLAVNGVGKPCTGEPHARFDGGPLAKQQLWRVGTMHPPGNRWD